MIRKMNGIKSNYEIPVLCSSNNKAISNVEKAELLASTFVKIQQMQNRVEKIPSCSIQE